MADTSLILQKSYTLLQQAVNMDAMLNYPEALRLYLTALDGFMSALKVEKNDRVKNTLKLKMSEYMNRAEELKAIISKGYVAPVVTQVTSCNDCPPSQKKPIVRTIVPQSTQHHILSQQQQHQQQQQQQHHIPSPSAPPQYQPTPTDHSSSDLILPSVPTTKLPNLNDLEITDNSNKPPPPFNPHINEINDNIDKKLPSNNNNLKLIKSIKILNGQIGNSYNNLFGEYLSNGQCQWIKIEDPYIRTRHQIDNFIKFTELVILKCIYKNEIKESTNPITKSSQSSQKIKIDLITSSDSPSQEDELKLIFYQLKDHLSNFNINFNYQFNSNLHDRSIELSNGYLIKLGRGLDIYQKLQNLNSFSSIGSYSQDLRLSLDCSIDVFLKN